ncbi:hypothetical protein BWI15_00270 [Kribbella sp. ALI-6-A]|nr:hypothetical protein BWI15_00270 [Kribbella sp. ALI-6-A]
MTLVPGIDLCGQGLEEFDDLVLIARPAGVNRLAAQPVAERLYRHVQGRDQSPLAQGAKLTRHGCSGNLMQTL